MVDLALVRVASPANEPAEARRNRVGRAGHPAAARTWKQFCRELSSVLGQQLGHRFEGESGPPDVQGDQR